MQTVFFDGRVTIRPHRVEDIPRLFFLAEDLMEIPSP
jgi:hypothetical protein